MIEHKYILEPYKGMNTRYRCPSCQQRDKTFSLYIDTETGEHLHPTVGRCNRESNCGHHYTPKQYFHDNNKSFDTPQPKAYKPRPVTPQPKPVSFILVDVFKASLNNANNESNNFIEFLMSLFGVEITKKLQCCYFIVNSDRWNGATIFWQIDLQGRIRAGKIMLYNPITGKRVTKPCNHIDWVHKVLKLDEFELKQCFFGCHLLIDITKPVAIVESEKTAIIASVYLPQFIWLAVGSLTNLNAEKCSILKGRTVILFPDLGGFEKWSNKAKELSHITKFIVSDLLECKASEAERTEGLDLADYLIRFKLQEFNLPEPLAIDAPKTFEPMVEVKVNKQIELDNYLIKPEKPKPENWDKDIFELENFFDGITLPTCTVTLNKCMNILDCSEFLKSHFIAVKENNGKHFFLPYLDRLKELRKVLTTNLNKYE